MVLTTKTAIGFYHPLKTFTAFCKKKLQLKQINFDPLYPDSCLCTHFYNAKDNSKNEDEHTQKYPLSMYLKIQRYTPGYAPSCF